MFVNYIRVAAFAGKRVQFQTVVAFKYSTMQEKAFTKGSVCPSSEPGKLRVYGHRFCPYSQRALLVAAAKDIPYELVSINLSDKPEWFLEKQPSGTVPLAELDGRQITESLIVAEFLDEAFDNNKLLPKDPYQKAMDKILLEKFGKVSSFFNGNFPVLVTGDKEKWEELFKVLDSWEAELAKRKSTFVGGNKPGMVDLMTWPWIERIEAVVKAYELSPIPQDRFPILTAWISAMMQDKAVQKCLKPPHLLKGYFDARIRGQPDFDFGL